MRNFWVADLTTNGEVRLLQEYEYRFLEQIDGAVELIGGFSAQLWNSPAGFEALLPGGRLVLRWVECSETSGIATLRDGGGELSSLSVLLCGRDAGDDEGVIKPLQMHLVRELHDTGFEAAFDVMHLRERPLLASVHFRTPVAPSDHRVFALADRCFAASYFRKMGLA